jgi:hypothetical protein
LTVATRARERISNESKGSEVRHPLEEMKMAQRSIVQIMPAGDWKAQFKTVQP